MKLIFTHALGIILALLLTPITVSAQASFRGLGQPSIGRFEVNALSANGNVVVGTIAYSGLEHEAARWTQAEGFVALGDFPGGYFYGEAHGVSADGSVIVGYGYQDFGEPRAFRWTQATGFVYLGDLPGGMVTSQAWAVSADGATVVGQSHGSTNGREAFRWTQATGMIGLRGQTNTDDQRETFAYDVSADGSVVVGQGWNITRGVYNEAFRWTQQTGMVGLGTLDATGRTRAFAISPNGNVIVGGQEGPYDYLLKWFRWTTATGMMDMGTGYVGGGIHAMSVSADGSTIVGHGNDVRAYIWDAVHGLRLLQDVLVNDYGLGTQLTGWTLQGTSGLSADGRTILGYGINPSGQPEAWIARLSNPPVSVSGAITLEQCQNSVQSLTFEFRPSDNSGNFQRTATLGANGSFSLTGILRKSYTLHIKGSKWLAKNVAVNASNGNVTNVNATLLGGDADNSNLVDVDDLAVLIASFDAAPNDANWNNGKADFDCNNIVDVEDLAILIRNFDREGDA